MNHMKAIADMIGVELDKPFNVRFDGFVLIERGLLRDNGSPIIQDSVLRMLLTGELKPEWMPKDGWLVWFLHDDGTIEVDRFDDNKYNLARFKNGLVFKTKDEAIARREELGWVAP